MNASILQKMIDCYEAGDAESIQTLNDLLLKHDEERRTFLLDIMDEDLLSDELKVNQVESLYSNTPTEHLDSAPKNAKAIWLYPLFTAAAVMIAIIALGVHFVPNEGGAVVKNPDLRLITETEPIAEVLATTTDAEWKEPISSNRELEQKIYQLISGNAHIRFSNGVELSLEAPVHLEIKDAFQVILHEGKIRAHVPESGYGFRIHTSDIQIKDLGTEFGVDVRPGVDTKLCVFDGEVELYRDSKIEPILAEGGYAAKWQKGIEGDHFFVEESEFPSLRSIEYQRWEVFHKKRMLDPALHLFLDFKNGDYLIPSIAGEEVSASAEAYVKLRGRWQRNSAYLIDAKELGVHLPNIEINGSFSIQAWFQLDVLESSTTVIMNTQRLHDRLHWQIDRKGKVHIGYSYARKAVKYPSPRVKQGQWNQVTMTYDSEKNQLKSYVNGVLASEMECKHKHLDLSNTSIGTWDNSGFNPRVLNGKIDEFAIWTRELSEEEILESYQIGLP